MVYTGGMLDLAARRMLPTVQRLAYRAWYRDPLVTAPRASRDEFLRLWNDARSRGYPAMDSYESQMGSGIDREWFEQLALVTQVVIKRSELCYQHGRLLYSTVSAIARSSEGTITILETGTARGFSALCMAKALTDTGKNGKIVTFDVLPHDVPMWWNCIADVDRGRQSRRSLLADYSDLADRYVLFHQGDTMLELPKVGMPRIQLAFIDGVHTYDYVMFEFSCVRPRQIAGDIIVFDDYTTGQFAGVVKAVDEICSRHGYSKEVIDIGADRAYVVATRR